MEEWLADYVKMNALNNIEVRVGNNLPTLTPPKIKEVGDIHAYLFLFTKYIELYEDNKSMFINEITKDEQSRLDFALLLNLFFNIEELRYYEKKFIFSEKEYIDKDNIGILIQTIKILHHRDSKDDYVQEDEDDDSPLARYMRKARETKKRILKKQREIMANNKSNESGGFAEIISTVSARHNSINLINIRELNYYQILDQYKRLMEIDKYQPVLSGNASEEYVKKLKHYSSKLIND